MDFRPYHDTLDKVAKALRKLGLSDQQIVDAVNLILNEGVLFVERHPRDLVE